MSIPFRIKLLTPTAKAPTQENPGDLWDLYADNFDFSALQDQEHDGEDATNYLEAIVVDDAGGLGLPDEFDNSRIGCWRTDRGFEIMPHGRILVKTGIAIELPVKLNYGWIFKSGDPYAGEGSHLILTYAVADIRPRSGLALKHGITVLNTPGTIDNSYRKEIGVILYNAGHKPYEIKRGDKISQMLIRPLYPSAMEIVSDFDDTGRGGFGSSGR